MSEAVVAYLLDGERRTLAGPVPTGRHDDPDREFPFEVPDFTVQVDGAVRSIAFYSSRHGELWELVFRSEAEHRAALWTQIRAIRDRQP